MLYCFEYAILTLLYQVNGIIFQIIKVQYRATQSHTEQWHKCSVDDRTNILYKLHRKDGQYLYKMPIDF